MASAKKKVKGEKGKKSKLKASHASGKKLLKASKVSSVKNFKFYDQLKLSDSYISLILGAVVVVGVSVLFLFFLKESRKPSINNSAILKSSISPSVTKILNKTYVLQENETLWDIAVREYGDGFRYTEIIEANNFENPDFVPPGTKIIIPETK